MIKTTVSYENFDGETVTEDLYFHLNKAELLELEVSAPSGSFADDLQKITTSGNVRDILDVFKMLIIASYGKRSEDGKRFLKTKEIREEFEGSEAYSEILFKLLSDEKEAIAFFQNLLPKSLLKEALATQEKDANPTNQEVEPKEDGAQLLLNLSKDTEAYNDLNAQTWGK